MPPDSSTFRPAAVANNDRKSLLLRLAAGWVALFVLTAREWGEMAHQWWNSDTYAHILLIPPILVWLIWLRRTELSKSSLSAFVPGLVLLCGSLLIWLCGRAAGINLVAQFGAVAAMSATVMTICGMRVMLLSAFPVAYSLFLVPFGDEIIAPLQQLTARIAVALTHASGVPAISNGLFIDTPAGRFVVAEECSGVKFLIAMVALATLVAWTSFTSWKRRVIFVLAAACVSVVSNGVRAWATIFVAQYIGAERAGGFDHIVYGWVFFALVIALVLGVGWRFIDRDPADAGLSATEADAIAQRFPAGVIAPDLALVLVCVIAAAFAVLARLI